MTYTFTINQLDEEVKEFLETKPDNDHDSSYASSRQLASYTEDFIEWLRIKYDEPSTKQPT
jgi:hypothetical protein